jgi:hypothetical protein
MNGKEKLKKEYLGSLRLILDREFSAKKKKQQNIGDWISSSNSRELLTGTHNNCENWIEKHGNC